MSVERFDLNQALLIVVVINLLVIIAYEQSTAK